ncbi:hypothetical protein [Sabulicella glaciei]|uniref:Uncharacterized protein n=1 Tax=Sabulicella glaciei TaxID=2984948 RepID=A0ABT3NW11_9PROT|nr:hypothetical protein [Roseococcus sp. MDT2-1-1]MCW8086342.1 hypothetical protein [Roseococcus sp. MDT2-1-1]
MPFSASALIPLLQNSDFTLWLYRSPDLKAEVAAAGYFNPASGRLRVGGLMLLQSGDAMAILPVRSNAATGPGVTLDGAVTPIAITRAIAQSFRITQVASAVVRTVVLAPIMTGIVVGSSIPVEAKVTGPVSQVVVTLRDSAGRVVPPAQTVNVEQGYALATLPTPPVGTGYRIRVEDTLDGSVSATSPAFTILPDLRLVLTESAARLALEEGGTLLQE